MSTMQLTITRQEEQLTACLRGELDHHSAGQLRQKIDAALLQHRCRRLVLDLSGLTFMDSSGIGLIMGRYRLLRDREGTLTVTGASPRIESLLRMAGMEKLPIWGDKERMIVNETHQ